MTDMTLDQAQQELGDLGYDVQVDPDTGSMVADLTAGRHYAIARITPGHTGQLVTQWFSETPGAPRKQHGNPRELDTVAQAVEYARDVAAAVALAHAADVRQAQAEQVPEIIYMQVAAEVAGRHRAPEPAPEEDPGIDFPGLEEACHGVDGIEWTDAEAAQDGAEPAEGVPA